MNAVIKAIQNENGKYVLTDPEWNEPQEGLEHETVESAMEDAKLMWPENSVWEGKRVADGWQIKID